MKINVLPSEIANMIAAGEVVERPASVVKELAENCVDAGASSISIEIKKGGITYIRVTDNGSGIEPDEIETAFFRHATSKIKTASDLGSATVIKVTDVSGETNEYKFTYRTQLKLKTTKTFHLHSYKF